MFFTILIVFLSIISLLVIHEFGHFIVAKRFGVRVEEFGVGYPPRLFGKKLGGTLYSVNLLPFGAFVRVPGEIGEGGNPGSFSGKPVWQRMLIVAAGALSFWIVASILLTFTFMIGVPQAISDDEEGPLIDPRVQIVALNPGSPAKDAGIRIGDIVRQIKSNGSSFEIEKVKEVQDLADIHRGKEITLTIQRGSEMLDVNLVPRVSPPIGEGSMGVALARTSLKSYSIWQAPKEALLSTVDLTKQIVLGWYGVLVSLFSGQGVPKGVEFVGIIGIGSMMTQAFQVGISYFLQYIALISLYLAVMNILPIPALDGGKIIFLVIEKLKGGPVNRKVEQGITTFFFMSMLVLMVWVMIKDIIRIF
ncbi:MAG: site-2 protease family protein [Candidatus Pacebacteria bacterium]|nr:site-2 protease family protein [Candidatus Paceibacterota bacterium]